MKKDIDHPPQAHAEVFPAPEPGDEPERPVDAGAPPPEAEPAPEPSPEPPPPPPAKPRRSWAARAFRWLLVLLVVFGAGALLVTLVFYLPMREELTGRLNSRSTELAAANEEIDALEARVEEMLPHEEANTQLREELAQAELHIALLSAQSDVAAARLALLNEEPENAQAALASTAKTLEAVRSGLEPDQREMVDAMVQRLELARSEISEDTFAAQSDLGVLDSSLIQLENSLFSSP